MRRMRTARDCGACGFGLVGRPTGAALRWRPTCLLQTVSCPITAMGCSIPNATISNRRMPPTSASPTAMGIVPIHRRAPRHFVRLLTTPRGPQKRPPGNRRGGLKKLINRWGYVILRAGIHDFARYSSVSALVGASCPGLRDIRSGTRFGKINPRSSCRRRCTWVYRGCQVLHII
jgi:hypothetical protein